MGDENMDWLSKCDSAEIDNHASCGFSTGIHGYLTVGHGELDEHGFWEHGCVECARRHELEHPEDGPVWPHKTEDIKKF